MAVDETVMDVIEGPIHVSFKRTKNTISPQRVKMLVGNYQFVKSENTGNQGLSVQLKFDPQAHKEWEKRTINERFWLTPAAINQFLGFLVACKINNELLREEPVNPPQFNEDGSPVTQCVHSVEEQIKAVYGAAVMCDLIEDSYETKAADGVTDETVWQNKVAMRGYSKV